MCVSHLVPSVWKETSSLQRKRNSLRQRKGCGSTDWELLRNGLLSRQKHRCVSTESCNILSASIQSHCPLQWKHLALIASLIIDEAIFTLCHVPVEIFYMTCRQMSNRFDWLLREKEVEAPVKKHFLFHEPLYGACFCLNYLIYYLTVTRGPVFYSVLLSECVLWCTSAWRQHCWCNMYCLCSLCIPDLCHSVDLRHSSLSNLLT